MISLRRVYNASGDGFGAINIWLYDDFGGSFRVDVVIERKVPVGYTGLPYAETLWGRLPDDYVRGVNELFTWDEEG